MKALVFNQTGAPGEVLGVSEVNLPEPRNGEVTVKMLASPINPADFLFTNGVYRIKPEFPQIAGFEGCGIVIDNGGTDTIPNGSLVAYRHRNAWSEFVNVPIEKIVWLPDTFPVEKAAQLSLNPLTAWAVLEQSKAAAGDWVVLSAGTSAVSKLIIQFAKQKGIKTIAIVREQTQAELLRSLGASAVIWDNDMEQIARQIEEAAKGERICSFIDAVGGDLATKVIPVIGTNGTVICYGLISNKNVVYHNADLIFKLITIEGFGIDKWMAGKSKAEMHHIWEQIIALVGEPDFIMQTAGQYPLEDFAAAFEKSKTTITGKVLFNFGPK